MLRLGAIGLGGLAGVQLDALAEIDGVDVVAGADIDPAAREAFETDVGAPAYDDHEAMLAAEELDVATIVTPHTLHYEQAVACIDRGVDVHLEKPMVTRVADAVDLVRRAAEADCVLQVGYQRHFHPAYREMRRVVETGRVGEVHMVSCYLGQDWIGGQLGSWRTDPDLSGGGQLSDSGSHLLDAALWTTDSEPREVTALMDYRDHAVDVNTAIAATLSGPDRPITASVGVSGDGTAMEEGLVVWGTGGHLEYTDGVLTVSEAAGETYTAEPTAPDYRAITKAKLEAFAEAVRGERDVAVPGEYGLRVTALTEAAYRSVEEGRPVDAQALVEDAREDR